MIIRAPLPEQPLVSVVMPVYNGAPYLAEAIGSILNQTYGNFEFIIVDDGSADGSNGIIAEFARRDPRIRPLFLPHGGISRALNTAVHHARGELIARMDADDIALPERFAVQIDWMRQAGVDLCGCWARLFGAEEQTWWFPEHPESLRHELLFRCAVLHPTYMAHARVLKENPYSEQAVFEDYELLTRLALGFRIGNVPRVLLRYRTHEAQIHGVRFKAIVNDLFQYQQRYFQRLFPHATAQDAETMQRLLARTAFSRPDQLVAAGKWLSRLARTPDRTSRSHMAQRWLGACRNSIALGRQCFGIYRTVARTFAEPGHRRPIGPWTEFGLWSSCMLPPPVANVIHKTLESFANKSPP